MAKWVILLTHFDIKYIDHKDEKGQIIFYQSTKDPLFETYLSIIDFLDESTFTITKLTYYYIYFDGSYT